MIYYIHKLLKKARFSGIRKSFVHRSSKIESGSSFLCSTMEKHSFCGYDCDIYMTEIGPYCSIANGVVIGGNSHPVEWASTSPVFYDNVDSIKIKYSRHERASFQKTHIGADVWIGRNALIKQGVVVGHGAVIGMGAVVTKDIPPYAIAVGNPAKLIRYRFDEDIRDALLKGCWWDCDDEVLTLIAKDVRNPSLFAKRVLELISDE